MASIITRNSVLSVMPETTEATPVAPSGVLAYLALQPNFSMTPNISSLTNEELKASLASSKGIQGLEQPQAKLSHYLKHSGTVGTAPEFNDLLKAGIGTEVVASTEYSTTNGSTTSTLKLSSSQADNFERGQLALIKDPTNGYRIRALDASASGTDLTLGFAIPSAPASGVSLGKCVLYKPANTGHQTLTLWHYLGNAGAVQMMAGARVTDIEVSVKAGDLINTSYSIEGVKYYFDPIQITSSTSYIDFTDDSGTYAASVTADYYQPQELADAIQAAMQATATTKTYTVTYNNSNGKFSIVGTGTVLTLKWNTGSNTANTIATKIGFSAAADSSGTAATTGYSSATALTLTSPYSPTYDSSDPISAKNQECMIGTTTDYACFKASELTFKVATPKANILDVCATSGVSGSVITSRKTTITVKALLEQFDAKAFYNFKVNQSVKFQFSFGPKSGGNWVEGKSGALYTPTCVITSLTVEDQDSLARISLTLEAFANSTGQGETYIGFV